MSIGRAILFAWYVIVFGLDGRVKPWWVLQDGGGDVGALVETPSPGAQAVVAGQWTYDAYGSCLTADVLRPHPLLHCGHKALFFDRLDVGVVASSGDELPRLVPYAHAVYQVRNRAYAPALGRFYQRDPNATAMALIEVSAYHGDALSPKADQLDLQSSYGDGASLYAYLGSNTWSRSDPLGLLFGLGYDDAALWIVGSLRGGLEEMTGQYADNMLSDVEWATDWDMGDDWHTRSDNAWVVRSFARGFSRGFVEQVENSFLINDIPDFTMAGKFGVAGSAVKALGRVMRSIRDLNRLVIYATKEAADVARRAAGVEAHSHHIVEQQMGKDMPWRKTLRKGEGPCVIVTDTQFHLSKVREEFNEAYRAAGIVNKKRMTPAEARAVIKRVYRDAPRLRNEALKYLNGH